MSKQLEIENKITYHLPSFVAEEEGERMKCAMLKSYDVTVNVIDTKPNDWAGFYNSALDGMLLSSD